jgi:hypothetical protein
VWTRTRGTEAQDFAGEMLTRTYLGLAMMISRFFFLVVVGRDRIQILRLEHLAAIETPQVVDAITTV